MEWINRYPDSTLTCVYIGDGYEPYDNGEVVGSTTVQRRMSPHGLIEE